MLDKLIGNLATVVFCGAIVYAGVVWVLKLDELIGVLAGFVVMVVIAIRQLTGKSSPQKPASEKPASEKPQAEKPAAR